MMPEVVPPQVDAGGRGSFGFTFCINIFPAFRLGKFSFIKVVRVE